MFSNDLASRRLRPSRPCATSTRQACRMGRNTGCLSSQPTRRTSKSWRRLSFAAAAAVTPRSTRTSSSRATAPCSVRYSSIHLTGDVLMRRGWHHQRTDRKPGHVDGHHPLGASRTAKRPAAVVEGCTTVGSTPRQVRVDDNHRRCRRRPSVGLASGRVQHCEGARPRAVARPATKLRPHPRPRPERLRQVAPLATRLRDVQHRVHHRSQIRRMLAAPLVRCVEHRFQQLPLVIG